MKTAQKLGAWFQATIERLRPSYRAMEQGDGQAAIAELFNDFNGGLVYLKTEHIGLRANVQQTGGTPGTDVFRLNEMKADILLISHDGTAYLRVLDEPPPWHFPVSSDKYPIEQWYIASRHLERGTIWAGGIHTGIDYNVEVYPRGDIDRGQPVSAITDGTIYATGYSQACLASIVIQVEHEEKPLWVRYWHLADDDLFKSWRPGLPVAAGQKLGHLGNYLRGGDHLHFDMCREAFHPCVWWTRMNGATNEEKLARWVDPVLILKAHLDPGTVDASLRIG